MYIFLPYLDEFNNCDILTNHNIPLGFNASIQVSTNFTPCLKISVSRKCICTSEGKSESIRKIEAEAATGEELETDPIFCRLKLRGVCRLLLFFIILSRFFLFFLCVCFSFSGG